MNALGWKVNVAALGWGRVRCGPCSHAPGWPRWSPISFRAVRLLTSEATHAFTLWIYTPNRMGRTIEIYFTRRTP